MFIFVNVSIIHKKRGSIKLKSQRINKKFMYAESGAMNRLTIAKVIVLI
jgi:hypothetical protein